jgi:hypothetical protein
MAHLRHRVHERHVPSAGRLRRYRSARPISHRRYDYLWDRVGRHLPWAAADRSATTGSVTPPGPRRSADFSYAIAREYGGHTDGDNNATTIYVRAETHEVAAALTPLTGALTCGVGGSDVTPPEPQRVERAIRRKVNQAPATAIKRSRSLGATS